MDRWVCGFIDRHFNNNFAEGIRSGQAPFPLSKLGYSLEEVKGTCDFVGINYYSRLRVGFQPKSPRTLFFQISVPPHKPQGDSGIEVPYGEVYPEGLRKAVGHFAEFKKPIYILENGVPDREDRIRPWVIESSVGQMRSLLAEGVDLRGYFHWTLVDNFEWNEGWHLRFGLYELDPVAQTRIARPSAQLYARVIRESMRQAEAARSFQAAEASQNGTHHPSTNGQSTNGHNLDVKASGQADAGSELSEERELGQ
jgi:beta-glucosidase